MAFHQHADRRARGFNQVIQQMLSFVTNDFLKRVLRRNTVVFGNRFQNFARGFGVRCGKKSPVYLRVVHIRPFNLRTRRMLERSSDHQIPWRLRVA